ncbi:hypothetical protein JVT61DRAFT_9444 [Boletus reticuloceps]|uniref:Uncharacterized protein n=1 Tax=Boletus reticuloceps TaxID=495285 RepID=A0A8I3A551_9AGAM|nr:hypothetical protein JVT61DRAFT_9444 [Boletus reticuloceps]
MADDSPAPGPTRHTRPSNVNKHPVDILKPAKKRHTKAEKAADNQRLKDAKAAEEKATVKSVGCLATMEMEAESKETEARANRPQPVCPHPWPHVISKATDGSAAQAKISGTLSDGATLMNPADYKDDTDVVSVAHNVKKPQVSLKESLQAWKA